MELEFEYGMNSFFEGNRVLSRAKIVSVSNNVGEAYKRMYPGVKIEVPPMAGVVPQVGLAATAAAGKRGPDGNENGVLPNKKQKRK